MTKKDKIYPLGFIVLSFLCFYPHFTSSYISAWLDTLYYFFPFRELTSSIIKQGILPLWNPYIYCGNPLMANMQSAMFYPMNIFYYVMPTVLAWKTGMFLTFVLMPFFVYMLAREHAVSEEGSFISAITFSYGYYTVIKAVELADINVILWMPAVLFFTKRFAQKRKLHDLFFTGITLALSLLGGHPQVFSYVFFIFIVYYFFFSSEQKVKLPEMFKGFILAGLVFLGLVFIQLAPTAEFIALCRRMMGFEVEASRAGFMRFEHFMSMLFPFIRPFVDSGAKFLTWSMLIEITMPALGLFAVAALGMNNLKHKIMLMSVFTFALFVALLGNMPFYGSIYKYLTPFHAITYAGKIGLLVLFVISLMSGMGLDTVFRLEKDKLKKIVSAMSLVLFVMTVAGLVMFFNGISIMKLYKMFFDPLMEKEKILETVENYTMLMEGLAAYLFLAWAFVLVIYLSAAGKINNAAATALLTGVVFINMYFFWDDNTNYYVQEERLLQKTSLALTLSKDKDMFHRRILSPFMYSRKEEKIKKTQDAETVFYRNKDSLFPNVPMTYRFLNADGFDSLLIGNFHKFKNRLSTLEHPWESDAFRLLSAKYIASQSLLDSKELKFVAKGKTHIYEYLRPMDTAFYVPAGAQKIFTDDDAVYEAEIFKKPFDPEKKILFSAKHKAAYSGMDSPGNAEKAQVIPTLVNCNEWNIRVKAPEQGFIVLTDNYYPGWEVYVNGVRKEILKTNWTFKSVYVEKGESEIRFLYRPALFWGAALFTAGLLLMLILYGLLILARTRITLAPKAQQP